MKIIMKNQKVPKKAKQTQKKSKIGPVVIEMPFQNNEQLSSLQVYHEIKWADDKAKEFKKLVRQKRVKNVQGAISELKRRGISV